MKNFFLSNALILLILTVPLIGYGTYLHATSTSLKAYVQHEVDMLVAANPVKDSAPGARLGIAITTAWPFTVMMQVFLILLLIGGISLARFMMKRTDNKYVSSLTYGCLMALCAAGTVMFAYSATESFRWNYTVLGVGQVVTSFGLIMGCIGLFAEIYLHLKTA